VLARRVGAAGLRAIVAEVFARELATAHTRGEHGHLAGKLVIQMG
jgi:hypothetical protein